MTTSCRSDRCAEGGDVAQPAVPIMSPMSTTASTRPTAVSRQQAPVTRCQSRVPTARKGDCRSWCATARADHGMGTACPCVRVSAARARGDARAIACRAARSRCSHRVAAKACDSAVGIRGSFHLACRRNKPEFTRRLKCVRGACEWALDAPRRVGSFSPSNGCCAVVMTFT